MVTYTVITQIYTGAFGKKYLYIYKKTIAFFKNSWYYNTKEPMYIYTRDSKAK